MFCCEELDLLVDLQRMDVVAAVQSKLARVGKRVDSHIVFVPCRRGGRGERTARKARKKDRGRKRRNLEDSRAKAEKDVGTCKRG